MLADTIVLVLALLLLGFTAGFLLKSSSDIRNNLNYVGNLELQKANSYLIWAAALVGIAFIMVIVALIITFIYKDKLYMAPSKYILIGISVASLVLVIIAGILAALGANIANKENADGAGWATTSAVLLLVFGSLLFIGYTIYIFIRKPDIIEDIQQFYDKNSKKLKDEAKRVFGVDRRPEAKSPLNNGYSLAEVEAAAELARRQGFTEGLQSPEKVLPISESTPGTSMRSTASSRPPSRPAPRRPTNLTRALQQATQ